MKTIKLNFKIPRSKLSKKKKKVCILLLKKKLTVKPACLKNSKLRQNFFVVKNVHKQ